MMASTLQVKMIFVNPHIAGGPAEPKPGISVCLCMCLPDIYFMDEKRVGERKFYIQILDIGVKKRESVSFSDKLCSRV